MQFTIQIPDDLARRLGSEQSSLPRRALEAFAAEEYRKGQLTKPDLRRLLGFETSYEIDGFLKSHGVDHEYTIQDLEQDRDALRSAGF